MAEKYDLKKILAEIEEDIAHEAKNTAQDENIPQKVITALRDKISTQKTREKS